MINQNTIKIRLIFGERGSESDKLTIQRGDISTLKGGPLKLVDKFSYIGSSVSSTENEINTQLAKVWTAIDKLLVT